MPRFLVPLALIAILIAPRVVAATEPAAPAVEGGAAGAEALPPEIVPTNPTGEAAPTGEAVPPTGESVAPGTGAERFKPAPAKGIQPTVSRLPKYWQCQDDLKHKLVVTPLDTTKPTVVLERGGKRVLATQQRSASGSKHMAPGGILFWDRGREATVQWGSNAVAATCTPLGS